MERHGLIMFNNQEIWDFTGFHRNLPFGNLSDIERHHFLREIRNCVIQHYSIATLPEGISGNGVFL